MECWSPGHLVTHTDMLWLCKATVATAGSCITRWLPPLEKYCHGSKLVRYSENGTHWRRGEGPTGIFRTTDSLSHSVSPGLGVTASPSSPPCMSFLVVAICSQPPTWAKTERCLFLWIQSLHPEQYGYEIILIVYSNV